MLLSAYAGNVYSYAGEDGMLAELCRRLTLQNGFCVEFGAGNGLVSSNTARLRDDGWSALLIESDNKYCQELQKLQSDRIECVCSLVEPEGPKSIDTFLSGRLVDVMSIDIDGADYFIFQHMRSRPRILVIEYNQAVPWFMDVRAKFPNNRFGASALSIYRLATEKRYSIVGATETNLFLVPNDFIYLLGDLCTSYVEIMSELPFMCGFIASDYCCNSIQINVENMPKWSWRCDRKDELVFNGYLYEGKSPALSERAKREYIPGSISHLLSIEDSKQDADSKQFDGKQILESDSGMGMEIIRALKAGHFYLYRNVKKWIARRTAVKSANTLTSSRSSYEFNPETLQLCRELYFKIWHDCGVMHLFAIDCVSSEYRNVLDIGCGTALNAPLIMLKNPNCHYTGIDANEVAIAVGRERLPNCRLIEGDFMTANIQPRRYDIVLCLSVLEHRIDFEDMISRIVSCAEHEVVLGFYRGLNRNDHHVIQPVPMKSIWEPKNGIGIRNWEFSYLNTYSEIKLNSWLTHSFPDWEASFHHLQNPILKEFPEPVMVRLKRKDIKV